MISKEPSSLELNELQISLLRLFNRPMSSEEVHSLKKVLVEHYSKLLKEELDDVVREKGYNTTDFDKMLNEPS